MLYTETKVSQDIHVLSGHQLEISVIEYFAQFL